MKKILSLIVFCLFISLGVYCQYFQGSFVNNPNPTPPPATLNQLTFKMKPTANLTTSISYMEFAFRYLTGSTPSFTVSPLISSNTVNFPLLNVQRLPDFVEGLYTYVKFVHNTATIPAATYVSGLEKDIFTISLIGPASSSLPMTQIASDLNEGN